MNGLNVRILATRPHFLLLSVILAFLGAAVAFYEGFFHLPHLLLATFGLVMAHTAVNMLNDYFDHRSGIDFRTERTPFSGGSGILTSGLLKPRQVLLQGLAALSLATATGVYFVAVTGWILLPLLLAAVFFILFYSPFILRHSWPEWTAGAGLGALPVMGMHCVLTGSYGSGAIVASIPSALLVHNLLLMNEFMDANPDGSAGRRTLPVVLGRRRAAAVYCVVAFAVYVWIIAWALLGVMPGWTLMALLTLPISVRAGRAVLHGDDTSSLLSAMSANLMVVLLTQILIGAGYLIGARV